MKTITAVEPYEKAEGDILVFLAGGITNCEDWQKLVIARLREHELSDPGSLDGLVVLNPRRENFPIDDPSAAEEQITWEFSNLQRADVLSMYFAAGKSDQPICMYELGRNVVLMRDRFPDGFADRIVVTYERGYSRSEDVRIQLGLAWAAEGEGVPDVMEADPASHAARIIEAYRRVKAGMAEEKK